VAVRARVLPALPPVPRLSDPPRRRRVARGRRAGRDPAPRRCGLRTGLGWRARSPPLRSLPLVRTAGLDKQPYREALAQARSLRPDGLIVGVYPAGAGVLYYGVDHPGGRALVPGDTVGTPRTLAQLESLLESPRAPVLLTAQESLLRAARPRLYARIERDFVPLRSFPAAIGDADITIWLPRS
jgi:hypothetical protein